MKKSYQTPNVAMRMFSKEEILTDVIVASQQNDSNAQLPWEDYINGTLGE